MLERDCGFGCSRSVRLQKKDEIYLYLTLPVSPPHLTLPAPCSTPIYYRKLISWGATLIAKPLVNCSDPMSGFFCLRKTTLKRATVLNPLGYKVGDR